MANPNEKKKVVKYFFNMYLSIIVNTIVVISYWLSVIQIITAFFAILEPFVVSTQKKCLRLFFGGLVPSTINKK